MVKRFPLPPPLRKANAHRDNIDVDLSAASSAEVRHALRLGGMVRPLEAVLEEFIPFVKRRVDGTPGRGDAEAEYQSSEERAELLSVWMALLYLGKRMGNVQFVVEEDGDDVGFEGATQMLSESLGDLSRVVGKDNAEAIYRKLESVTDRVLKRHFGRAR
jgi:hypothetical protein